MKSERWLVTVYGKRGTVLDTWVIDDRTEHEAFREAEADILREYPNSEDWSLSDVSEETEE